MNDGSSRDDDVRMTPNTGGLRDGWFVEEDQGSTRLSLRVDEHLHSERSEFQKIDVYRSGFHGVFLTLDDLMMVTERDEFVYHEMLTHVPLSTMQSPRSVLVIGGGDCGCVREVLRHRSVERVVQCEIDERVTRVSERFFDWVPGSWPIRAWNSSSTTASPTSRTTPTPSTWSSSTRPIPSVRPWVCSRRTSTRRFGGHCVRAA